MKTETDEPHDPGIVDAFLKQHIPPEALESPDIISPTVYNRIRQKFDKDDLEIFAIALAFIRNYTYVCLDQAEATRIKNKIPQLKVALISDFVNVAESPES